ncbi:hypothetical protein [Pararhodobacter sp.]|uniref:hypothetical protein n=1 Tax=Pararhodobacter sp. TaxID=2127056 RepID=UPI002AFE34EB|nr:hypothetical protein [Pararhodobacter sp.]
MTQDKPTTRPTSESPETTARRVQSVTGTKGDSTREARIKSALKANIAKRKAQAKARETDEGHND